MTLDIETYSDSRNPARIAIGPWGRLRRAIVAVVVAQQARRMLDQIVRPYRARGSPELPAHLLEDVGLPRDYYAGRHYWDYQ